MQKDMANFISDAYETYKENIRLVLLFSLPFIIAFAIPLLAPLPTYISSGGIFLRTASVFINFDVIGAAVIIVALILSLLFLSFAFVAISLIVKSKRTHTKTPSKVMKGIESYTAKVFVVLLIYAIVLAAVNLLGYFTGYQALLTAIVGFVGFLLIFYAPSAIVIDDKRIGRALRDSARLVFREPQYFIVWLLLLTAIVSVLDAILIFATGTVISQYVLLVVNSLFVLPYFVILQAEAYMKRFPLLKH